MALKTTPGTTGAAASSAADAPPSTDTDKDFHTLHRSAEPQSDPYWAQRWGLVRHLPKLHDAAQVVAQIGERM